MPHGQNGGSKKRKQKTVNFTEIWGEMYKFCGKRGKFINFVEMGGNMQFMHHWLRGMDAPELATN